MARGPAPGLVGFSALGSCKVAIEVLGGCVVSSEGSVGDIGSPTCVVVGRIQASGALRLRALVPAGCWLEVAQVPKVLASHCPWTLAHGTCFPKPR